MSELNNLKRELVDKLIELRKHIKKPVIKNITDAGSSP